MTLYSDDNLTLHRPDGGDGRTYLVLAAEWVIIVDTSGAEPPKMMEAQEYREAMKRLRGKAKGEA